jgi:hypothetical protein
MRSPIRQIRWMPNDALPNRTAGRVRGSDRQDERDLQRDHDTLHGTTRAWHAAVSLPVAADVPEGVGEPFDSHRSSTTDGDQRLKDLS